MVEQKLKTLLKLIERSPDAGDGWRAVSKPLMPLIIGYPDQSLIEWKEHDQKEGWGYVRLTDKGTTVAPYL